MDPATGTESNNELEQVGDHPGLDDSLDQAEPDAGHDGTHDRAHAADHHDREHGDDEIRPHHRVHVENRRRQDAGERGQRHAVPVGQRDHQRHVDPERLQQLRIFRPGPQIGPELGALDDVPRAEAYDQRSHHDPDPVLRQEHEAEILPARQLLGHRVAFARYAEPVTEEAFDDQRQAEREEQPVEVVQLVEPFQHAALEEDAKRSDQQRRKQQRPPVVDAEVRHPDPGQERAHHVLGAVGEVDDVEKAEDNRQPEAEDGVERAIEQADEQLPEQALHRHTEHPGHGNAPLPAGCLRGPSPQESGAEAKPSAPRAVRFTS